MVVTKRFDLIAINNSLSKATTAEHVNDAGHRKIWRTRPVGVIYKVAEQ